MILADSSAWIEYDRATGSALHLRLRQLLIDEGPLATTEPVVMEVLAGARSDRDEVRLLRLLRRAEHRSVDPTADFVTAARLYRQCRRAEFTLRGLRDCLVAAVALRHGDTVLTSDADLLRIADVVGLPVAEATPP